MKRLECRIFHLIKFLQLLLAIKYLIYSITINFNSWIVGMLLNMFLMRYSIYSRLQNYNFIRSPKVNSWLGLHTFKWIVKNTFFKFFNKNINLKGMHKRERLKSLRLQMTYSEVSHLIAFLVVMILSIVFVFMGKIVFAIILFAVNILMNLYPSLLQQMNKRRIDKLALN